MARKEGIVRSKRHMLLMSLLVLVFLLVVGTLLSISLSGCAQDAGKTGATDSVYTEGSEISDLAIEDLDVVRNDDEYVVSAKIKNNSYSNVYTDIKIQITLEGGDGKPLVRTIGVVEVSNSLNVLDAVSGVGTLTRDIKLSDLEIPDAGDDVVVSANVLCATQIKLLDSE